MLAGESSTGIQIRRKLERGLAGAVDAIEDRESLISWSRSSRAQNKSWFYYNRGQKRKSQYGEG